MSLIGTDAGHYNKYMTTLGVSMVAGALSLSGLFFQVQGDLLVEDQKLEALAPTAQAVIERRQEMLLTATSLLPYALLIIVAVGVLFTLIGLLGWARRQAVSDKREDLEGTKLEVEVRKMTSEEREQKLIQEVDEPPQEPVTPERRPGRVAFIPPRSTRTAESEDSNDPYGHTLAPVELYREIEKNMARIATDAFGPSRTNPNLIIGSGGKNVPLDIVVAPSAPDTGYVFEVKYIRNAGTDVARRVREAVAAATSGAVQLSDEGETYRPVAVIVCEDRDTLSVQSRVDAIRERNRESRFHDVDFIILGRQTLQHWSPAELLAALDLPQTTSK